MICPYCQYQDSKVVDSRSVSGGVRRRRQCLHCGSRFTTYERVQSNGFLVVKKDGRREEFSRDKLTAGIGKACAKRPVTDEEIGRLVGRIEEELHQLGRAEVSTSTIGGLVVGYLRELDRIAYIRFASVYREFADIESFKEEADALIQGHGTVSAAQLPLMPDEQSLIPVKGGRKGALLERGGNDA